MVPRSFGHLLPQLEAGGCCRVTRRVVVRRAERQLNNVALHFLVCSPSVNARKVCQRKERQCEVKEWQRENARKEVAVTSGGE